MTLVIETERLIDLLTTLVQTSGNDDFTDGALLYTAHGPFGDEPGAQQLIAGISTNGVASSHYYVPVDGGTFETSFWPTWSAGLVAAAFGSLVKAKKDAETDEPHVVRVELLPDHQVVVKEYDTPSGVEVKFNLHDPELFPAAGVARLIEGISIVNGDRLAEDEGVIDDGPAELWDNAGLGLLLRIAKKMKTRLVVEKASVTGAVCRARMEGKENWRGAVVPSVPVAAATLNDGVEAVDVHLDMLSTLSNGGVGGTKEIAEEPKTEAAPTEDLEDDEA